MIKYKVYYDMHNFRMCETFTNYADVLKFYELVASQGYTYISCLQESGED